MRRDLIVEAMFEHWGPRCDDFDPDCEGCRAWAQFAALEAEASEGERLRAALVVAKRSILEDKTGAVTCTVWVPSDVSPAETLVDHIDAALIPEAPVREAE